MSLLNKKKINDQSKFTFTPIGFFHSSKKYNQEAPHQINHLFSDEESKPSKSNNLNQQDSEYIELKKNHNFEQALSDLETCTHLWVIFAFHKNTTWKPKVLSPRSSTKRGVFATRSPYRPNPIGISVCKIIKIIGLKIFITKNDILDQTPILDIKPYHPESDLIANAEIGWLKKDLLNHAYDVQFSENALVDINKLQSKNPDALHLKDVILEQLSFDPLNNKKKRVKVLSSKENIDSKLTDIAAVFAFRYYRVEFQILNNNIIVQKIIDSKL